MSDIDATSGVPSSSSNLEVATIPAAVISPATPLSLPNVEPIEHDSLSMDEPTPPSGPVKRQKSFWREILETVIMTIVIFFIIKSLIANFRIVGTSMEPNFHTNQLILVNKASYFHFDSNAWLRFIPFVKADGQNEVWLLGGPHRGDVVVLEPPDAPTDDYIKRVIGLPGDKIEVRGGIVYINEKPLDEPYIKEKPFSPYGPAVVPTNSFFVMGDNRNGSRDSRSFGFLPFDKVVGKAMLVYWPFGTGWGPIADPQYK